MTTAPVMPGRISPVVAVEAATDIPDIAALAACTGYVFSDEELAVAALTHPSVAGKVNAAEFDRLEFLGDRVLGLCVAEMLLARFPRERVGAINKRFIRLVDLETCAIVAVEAGIAPLVRRARADAAEVARSQTMINGNACEAVIGALFTDGGLAVARAFVMRHWEARIDADIKPLRDPKSTLQEWGQRRGAALPVYEATAGVGKPHERLFTVTVTLTMRDGSCHAASGTGRSKQQAEKEAATALLALLKAAQ